MDSSTLKTEALCWLRFGKKLPYIATEAGCWSSDVLGVCDAFSVEVEVKVSVTDLKREFTTKAAKHYLFANVGAAVPKGTPNYFYFYVPKELEAAALAIVKEKAPKAGLAIYTPDGWLRDGQRTVVAHRATKLHDAAPTAQFIKTVLQRMGSELCGRYILQQKFLNDLGAGVQQLYDALPALMQRVAETPDIEEPNHDPAAGS